MTIPVSTVPAVKAYLVTQLRATLTAVAGEQLLVVYDQPGTYHPGDVVIVGDVTAYASQPGAMVGGGGAGWIEEQYSLEVVVEVFRGGDYAQTAYERAWTLASAIAAVIRTDPSLGQRAIESRPGAMSTTSTWDDERLGRVVHLTLAVDVAAWL